MDKVSVILTVYNQEKYIEEAVQSILNQSFQDFELLIHDDGSTDNTYSILKRLFNNNDKIQLTSSPNQGKCRATNMLVNKSKYDWIALMDADDIMLPQRLEKQLLFHKNNQEIAASSSNCFYIDENGLFVGRQISMQLDTTDLFNKKISVNENIFCAYTALMIKKSVWLDLGGLRDKFVHAHDLDLYVRLVEKKYILLIVNDFFMKYRIHKKSATQSKYFLTSLYGDYVLHCKELRKTNLSEISFEGYRNEFNSKNIFVKINWYRKKTAQLLQKKAGVNFYRKNVLLFLMFLGTSIILNYKLILPAIKKQIRYFRL